MKKRVLLSIAALVPMLIVSPARGDKGGNGHKGGKHNNEVTIRWDIVHFISFAPLTDTSGGQASARAEDNSRITLTGSGTFTLGDDDEVTGGGTWLTSAPNGTTTGSGTYQVTGLIKFDQAPGSAPTLVDLIGPNVHSGLALLGIRYSDGSLGVLVVSCHLPVGSPDTLFEGITTTKGFADYWNHDEPVANVDGNRTAFHVISDED